MKKISLVLTALVLATTSFAQVQFGLKGGVNISNLDDNAAPGATERRYGYHFGGLAHIHISRVLGLQPELVYSRQGAKYTLPTYNGETKAEYLNLPVLVQYMFNRGLRLQTGPQLGYLLAAKFKPTTGAERDIKEENDNADFSWVFGAGYLTPIGLGIDARYNLGINNVYKDENPKAKHQVFQVGLFWQFPSRGGRGTTTSNAR